MQIPSLGLGTQRRFLIRFRSNNLSSNRQQQQYNEAGLFILPVSSAHRRNSIVLSITQIEPTSSRRYEMHRTRRMDPFNTNLRNEQKAILNALLEFIYDSYYTTQRIEKTVESIYSLGHLRYIHQEDKNQPPLRYNTFPAADETPQQNEKFH
ncbi:hypothetical protein WR25_03398 [Diploscapter pachys]|uniref:Uncharacterized protein n=1 Tax=Diploscapter pachys TaxID=2018661 RepID=A0A2A2LTM0_9BILA|nr:hypothetical protein WR25_03398 [Diploscapter pachys]